MTTYTDLVRDWEGDMRDAQPHVVEAVRTGDFLPPQFTTIEIQHPTLPAIKGRIDITNDAIRFGDARDSKRVSMSHETAQAVADLLGLRTATMWLLDNAAAQAAVRVEPVHNTPSSHGLPVGHTSQRKVAEEYSDLVDARIGKRKGLVVTVGKAWVNSNRLLRPENEKWGKRTAINAGWHTELPPVAPPKTGPRAGLVPGVQSWQREGGAHDVTHVDPSQVGDHFIRPTMLIDTAGIVVPMPVDVVAMDPILSALVRHDGPGPMRHPWLSPCMSLAEGGSCPGGPPIGGGGTQPPPPAGVASKSNWPIIVAGGAAVGLAVLASRWTGVA